MMMGIINVLKPPGMTSHDVVARIRGLASKVRVGHTGTLDPGAVGVLPVCVGRATRLTQYLLEADKEYRAEVLFNAASDTEDWTGRVTLTDTPETIDRVVVEEAIVGFQGESKQIPPMLSALRHRGMRLYDLHRQGKVVERQARAITVYHINLVRFWPGTRPRALLDICCSRGTYIRTLAVDLGRSLGCDAMLNFLVRTRVGPFTLASAVTLEELEQAYHEECLDDYVLSARTALSEMRPVAVDWPWAIRIRNGTQPMRDIRHACPDDVYEGEKLTVVDPDQALVAVVEATRTDRGTALKLLQVFDREPGNGG